MRNKLTQIIKDKLNPIPEEIQDPSYPFYYRDYKDNLIRKMAHHHKCEYCRGSGGELEGKGRTPAKMASVVSSSAMTFNLLGNDSIMVKGGYGFAPGNYRIAYEKQMYTLNGGGNPANLDAFLYNEEAGEAIFCEMKMLEWLSPPGVLKAAYRNEKNYFHKDAFAVFANLIEKLKSGEKENGDYEAAFSRYDAWQMLKHTMAIYNATSEKTKDRVERGKSGSSMAGQFKKITLLNVVFEMDDALIEQEKLKQAYKQALGEEHDQKDQFIKAMMDPADGLENLFQTDCNATFGIRYMSAGQFVKCLDKSTEEFDKLKRYCCGG